jgi:hypothetical protein
MKIRQRSIVVVVIEGEGNVGRSTKRKGKVVEKKLI